MINDGAAGNSCIVNSGVNNGCCNTIFTSSDFNNIRIQDSYILGGICNCISLPDAKGGICNVNVLGTKNYVTISGNTATCALVCSVYVGGTCNTVNATGPGGQGEGPVGNYTCNYVINSNITSGVCNRLTASGYYNNNCIVNSNILGGCCNLICTNDYSSIIDSTNIFSGCKNTITFSGGTKNVSVSACNSNIFGGVCNCIIGSNTTLGTVGNNNNAIIGGGCCNTVSCGKYTSIINGTCNTANGQFTFIAGGSGNNTNGFINTFILGTDINATANNFTYVNNIEAKSTVNPTKVILSSPNGTRYNITVTNIGTLSAGLA